MSVHQSRADRMLARAIAPGFVPIGPLFAPSSEPASSEDLEGLAAVLARVADCVGLVEETFAVWAEAPIRGGRSTAERCRDVADMLSDIAGALDEVAAGRPW